MILAADRPTKIARAEGSLKFIVISNGGPVAIKFGRDPLSLANEGTSIASGSTSPQITVTADLWIMAIAGQATIQVSDYGTG
jgi:hypothetical protein